MAEINTYCEFQLIDHTQDRNVEETVYDVDGYDQGYRKLRSKLCEKNNIDYTEFEKRFSVATKRLYKTFSDNPWDTEEELKDDLESLSSINEASHIPPTAGRYSPPKYVVDTDSPISDVRDDVNDYYDGLTVQSERGVICVVVTVQE